MGGNGTASDGRYICLLKVLRQIYGKITPKTRTYGNAWKPGEFFSTLWSPRWMPDRSGEDHSLAALTQEE